MLLLYAGKKHKIGNFEGAKTFLTQIVLSAAKGYFGVKNQGPLE
jgi:hypothetical protein